MKIEDAVKMARNVEPLPPACTLNQLIVLSLLMTGEDPCARCNQDRGVCGGRPKRQEGP